MSLISFFLTRWKKTIVYDLLDGTLLIKNILWSLIKYKSKYFPGIFSVQYTTSVKLYLIQDILKTLVNIYFRNKRMYQKNYNIVGFLKKNSFFDEQPKKPHQSPIRSNLSKNGLFDTK